MLSSPAEVRIVLTIFMSIFGKYSFLNMNLRSMMRMDQEAWMKLVRMNFVME